MTASRCLRAIAIERVHVGHLAVQVHRHQCLYDAARAAIDEPIAARSHCARASRRLRRGQVEGRGIDVAEQRPRAEPRDDARRREEGKRRRDDLVAWSDVERHQRDQQRVRARRNADTVRGMANRPRPRFRAPPTFGPRTKRWQSQTSRIACFDLGAQRRVLPLRSSSGTFTVSAISLACGVPIPDRRERRRLAT